MVTKQIDKTIIEVSKQELLDELVKNFIECTKDKNNHLESVFNSVNVLYETVKNIYENNYLKIFQDNRAIKCLPEEVFLQVERYFFNDIGEEEDDEDGNDAEENTKILSFKSGFRDFKDKELEIVIVDNGVVLAKIPESEIPY